MSHQSSRPARYIPLAILLFLVSAASARAEDMRIVAPYAGILSNVYADESTGLDLKDSGFLSGLYFQWINPERYQWNAFVYYAPDVNYTRTIGGHFIFDYYFGPDWYGKFVAGAGLAAINNKFDAGSDIAPFSDFTMDYTIWVPYLRAGKYFKTKVGPADLSLLPWAGVQPEWIRGDLSMTMPAHFPMPEMTIDSSMDDYSLYGIAGANLKVSLFHFVDLEGKYKATFDKSGLYSSVDALANLFFTRSMGLSYRYKYMESLDGTGSNSYHYFGLAYLF
jgi:hypothetical protein